MIVKHMPGESPTCFSLRQSFLERRREIKDEDIKIEPESL